MTGPSVPPDEMPGFPAPGRAGPELDDELLDALLSGAPMPPGAPDRARVTGEMLARLAGPADAGELIGEEAARAAFVRAAYQGRRGAAAGPVRRGPSWLPGRISARLTAALAALVMILGGTVAAYAGVLPEPVQNLAHHAIGAPAPRPAHHHVGHHPSAPVTAPPSPTVQPTPAPSSGTTTTTPGKGKHKGDKKAKKKAKKAKKTAAKAKKKAKKAKKKAAKKAKKQKRKKKATG
jgi:hypothetical protein